ncbi:MAG: hypothetical protein M1831_005371 [Alyxoria varia]|nr:MAG: hypothetical protein M1831_005371 [Alyxoria varia]
MSTFDDKLLNSSTAAQVSSIRQELKRWEREFATANDGRKATRDEIKKYPEIAAKYKAYNALAGKATTNPPKHASPRKHKSSSVNQPHEQRTPSKHRRRSHATNITTPRKDVDHEAPSPVDHQNKTPTSTASGTPVAKLNFVGPTPQKDGRVLGLFDLLGQEDEGDVGNANISTPSKTATLAKANENSVQRRSAHPHALTSKAVLTTPSKGAHKSTDQFNQGPPSVTSTPQHQRLMATPSRAKHTRTPQSSATRFLLDKMAGFTPSSLRKRKFAELTDSPSKPTRTPASNKSFGFSTPAFLRRNAAPVAPLDAVWEEQEAEEDDNEDRNDREEEHEATPRKRQKCAATTVQSPSKSRSNTATATATVTALATGRPSSSSVVQRRGSQAATLGTAGGTHDLAKTRPNFLKRRSFGRSLSTLMKEVKQHQEERFDEDLDILNELENDTAAVRTKAGAAGSGDSTRREDELQDSDAYGGAASVQVEDSQAVDEADLALLGPDRERFSSDEVGDDENRDPSAGGVIRKPWKKKGQKRQTRRAILRPKAPVAYKPQNPTTARSKRPATTTNVTTNNNSKTTTVDTAGDTQHLDADTQVDPGLNTDSNADSDSGDAEFASAHSDVDASGSDDGSENEDEGSEDELTRDDVVRDRKGGSQGAARTGGQSKKSGTKGKRNGEGGATDAKGMGTGKDEKGTEKLKEKGKQKEPPKEKEKEEKSVAQKLKEMAKRGNFRSLKMKGKGGGGGGGGGRTSGGRGGFRGRGGRGGRRGGRR